jgi:hypothetical protein
MTSTTTEISATLANVLTATRAHCNARVAEERHRDPNFDTAAFASFVRTGLDSVAQSLSTATHDQITSAMLSAYDIALDLVSQGLAGPAARTDVVNRVWSAVAPRYAALIAVDAIGTLGALSNAAIHITNVPRARINDWLSNMALLAGHVDNLATLRRLGQVLAWRAGLAHFREGALLSADSLPPSLALLAVGAPASSSATDWPVIRNSFRENIWYSPNRDATHSGLEVGEFTGFGGTFAQPPEVRAVPQGFIVRSADRHHLLMADAYGAVLLPATGDEFAQASAEKNTQLAHVKIIGSQLDIHGRRVDLDLPAEGLTHVNNQHTVALTSLYTHTIRLLPRT